MTLKRQQAFPQPLSNGSFRPFSQKSPGAGTKSRQQQHQPPLVPVKGFPPRQQRRHSYGGGAPLSTRSSSCSGTPHLEDKRGRSLSLPESPSWLHQVTPTISTPGSSSSKNSRRSRSSARSAEVVTTLACPICGLTLTYRQAAAHVKACSTSLIDRQQRRYLQDAERRELKRYHHKKLHAAAGATTTTTTTTPPSEPAELVSLSLGVELVTVQSAATLGPNSASATSIVVPTTLQLVPAHLVDMSATSILSQKVEGSSAEDFVLSDDSELGSPPATVLSRKIHTATTTTTTTTTTATLPVSSTLKLEPPDPRVGMLVAELPPCAVPAHGNRFHPALAPTAVRSPYAEVIPNFGSSSSNGSSSYVGRGVSSSGGGSNSSTTYVVGEPSVRYYRVLSAPASAEF